MKTGKDVLKSIKDNDVKYVDFRFTDPRGKWQHVTFDVSIIDEDTFADGVMFDGSSIAGWKAINESDMTLMPDPVTAVMDPFFAEPTLVMLAGKDRTGIFESDLPAGDLAAAAGKPVLVAGHLRHPRATRPRHRPNRASRVPRRQWRAGLSGPAWRRSTGARIRNTSWAGCR